MSLNLDKNFLNFTNDEIEAFFNDALERKPKDKKEFLELAELYIQLDSLVETYSDLGLEIKDFNHQLESLEKKVINLMEGISLQEREVNKLKTYLSFSDEENSGRRDLFKRYEEIIEESNFSLSSALNDFYENGSTEKFSKLDELSLDKNLSDTMIEILKGRSEEVFNKEIFDKTLSLMESLSDDDFAPHSKKKAPKTSYNELIDKVLSIFSDYWETRIEKEGHLLNLGNKGFIYLDPFKREGKFDRPWTQVIQTGNGKDRPAICVVGFPFEDEVGPGELRSLFHEFGHAFHHILTSGEEFLSSGLNSLDADQLEYPSILMERYLLDKSQFLALWNNEEAFEYASDHYKVLLNKTIFFTLLDQVIHRQKYQSLADLISSVDSLLSRNEFKTPYLNGKSVTIFGHAFEDDMYAGKYFWYLSADLWFEEIEDLKVNPFL